MNLNAIAAGVVSAVNPSTLATLQISAGSTVGADGNRVAKYVQPSVPIQAQVQPLTTGDLRQVEGLNLQGQKVAIYLNGEVKGLIRPQNRGGDLVTISTGPQAGVYLVAMVLEQWTSWVKVAATLQNGS